ncbi:phospholipase a2 [Mucor ambiguus]|uniref:Phospholipase a2 n=1 Tax=Mucor ambiguus TaxID=91626 RepID=A0A0C9MET4_9FUNG|nr:phospholipase a2 [Mucor ambiguus]
MQSAKLIHILFYVALLSSATVKQSVFAFQSDNPREQHVFQQQQQQAISNSILSPFSYEWIQLLEQFHNTLGHRNTSKDDDACLFPVPAFDCEPFIWHDAILHRDAYHLRPNDIKAVIAIGDSISAGFGMISGKYLSSDSIFSRKHRKVFSVGGDKGEYTIPNYLAAWTNAPNKGPPTGYTLPLSRGKQLDNAVSGSKTQELDDQISRLVHLLKAEKYKDIRDEWKLITLFIGANNVCVLCEPPMTTLPGLAEADVFEENVRQALTRIKDQVPKSFVNLVALFNVSSVYEASRGDPYCEFVLDPSHMVICSCIQGDEKQRRAADRVVNEYNLRLEKLEQEFKQQDTMQFGLSYQPGFKEFPIAKYKQSYFSGVDCFHPNKCANQLMSILLWNNMFSNKQDKKKEYDVETLEFVCPSPANPYIQ